MSDEINFLEMFEGMEPSQVKELTDRIRSAVKNEYSNFKQGVKTMDDELKLTDQEREELNAGIEALAQGIVEKRKAAELAPKIEAYRRDMLAARGKPHILQQIKARARAQGVPVDQVDFS